MKAMLIAASLLLGACEHSAFTAQPQQRMDPNAAAMMWMLYSQQMADDAAAARAAPVPRTTCNVSGNTWQCY